MTLLVFMGSGETAPSMVGVHRDIFSRSSPGQRVMLDTPFGFQDNADDLTTRTRRYFKESVGQSIDVARWRRADQPVIEQEVALASIADATWLFSGPGSPTYALAQWRDSPIPAAMLDLLRRDGTLVLGSAAAVTAGTHAVPVYEIYKVGAEPSWVEGLDLLGSLTGINAAVIPHFDNAEGGTYDTRYCYLGEQRLALMERALPDDCAVLGIDEHTAVIIDGEKRSVEVVGIGVMTVRRGGCNSVLTPGTVVTIDQLADLVAGTKSATAVADTARATHLQRDPAAASKPGVTVPSLLIEVTALRAAFDGAIQAANVDAAVTAILAVEAALRAWSTDSLQSDEADQGRRMLRAMVVKLGALAKVGATPVREIVAPFVQVLVDQRQQVRGAGDFASSDLLRDQLLALGVEVKDTPNGTEWELSADPAANPEA